MTDASAKPIRYLAVSEDDNPDDDSGQQGSSGGGGGLHYVEIGCYLEFRAGGQTRWILERTVVPIPRTSDASRALGDAVDNYVATVISDRVFTLSDRWWIVCDPGGLGADDAVVQHAQEGLHKLLLGDRVEEVWRALGVPAPGVAGGIAGQLALPIDGPLGFIEQLLQVAGMAVGVCVGMPVLTTACCKAFLHDQVTRGVTRGTHALIKGMLTSAPEPPAPPEPPGPPDAGRRPPADGLGDGPVLHPAGPVTLPNEYRRPTSRRRPRVVDDTTRRTIQRNTPARERSTRPDPGGFTTSR